MQPSLSLFPRSQFSIGGGGIHNLRHQSQTDRQKKEVETRSTTSELSLLSLSLRILLSLRTYPLYNISPYSKHWSTSRSVKSNSHFPTVFESHLSLSFSLLSQIHDMKRNSTRSSTYTPVL